MGQYEVISVWIKLVKFIQDFSTKANIQKRKKRSTFQINFSLLFSQTCSSHWTTVCLSAMKLSILGVWQISGKLKQGCLLCHAKLVVSSSAFRILRVPMVKGYFRSSSSHTHEPPCPHAPAKSTLKNHNWFSFLPVLNLDVAVVAEKTWLESFWRGQWVIVMDTLWAVCMAHKSIPLWKCRWSIIVHHPRVQHWTAPGWVSHERLLFLQTKWNCTAAVQGSLHNVEWESEQASLQPWFRREWTINILKAGNKQGRVGESKGAEDGNCAYSKLAKAAATRCRDGFVGPMLELLVNFSYNM